MTTLFRYLVLFLSILAIFSACRKLVTVDPPRNQLVTQTVFTDSLNATSAILGLYTRVMNASTTLNFANGSLTVYTALAGDELLSTGTDALEAQFFQNAVSPVSNSVNDLWWRTAYQLIYQANACLEGLERSTTLGAAVKNHLRGEALLWRAFIYHHLVQLYGGVPLVLTTDYEAASRLPRANEGAIYDQLTRDLEQAQELLPLNYMGEGRTRPNRLVATALLARLYLLRQQWDKAAAAATTVITSSAYQLEADLNGVFLAGSREALWQWRPLQPGYETAEGQRLLPTSAASARPRYVLQPGLLSSFEPGDKRRSQWIKTKTVSGQPYAYPFKYKLRNVGNPQPVEYYMVIRYAEVLLILSEALANQGELSTSLDALNAVRVRSGLTALSGLSQPELLAAIYRERRHELFSEWAHRWYDLRRTGSINETLAALKPSWQPTDALMPVPAAELSLNNSLEQNPGY